MTNSRLLSLPPEVREKILVDLIGNNLIHIKHLQYHDLADAKWVDLDELDPKLTKEGAFRHAICVAAQSEQSVYDGTVLGTATVPEGLNPDYFVTSCTKLHQGCKMSQIGTKTLRPEEYGVLTLDLKVLGVCRQLYEEANHLLWTTNTFSFHDATSLNKFLASLNPAQKRNMSSMHISAMLDHWGRSRGDQAWSVALKLSYINMLRGVQNLHLRFEHCYDSVSARHTFVESYEQCKLNLDEQIKPFLRLRALDAKNITVVLSDTTGRFGEDDSPLCRWDRTTKNQYAGDFRDRLLAPNGAELVSKDAEIENTANEIGIMNNAKIHVTIARSLVHTRRVSIDELRVRAIFADRQARKYAAKAAKAATESGNATNHQKEARSKAEADRYRQQLRNLRVSLTNLQGKASQAIAKYKRAKARVLARKAKNKGEDDNGDDNEDLPSESPYSKRYINSGGELASDDSEGWEDKDEEGFLRMSDVEGLVENMDDNIHLAGDSS